MGLASMANRFWVVRCEDFDADYVEKKGIVFIGWQKVGDLRNYKGKDEDQTRERIKTALSESYRDDEDLTKGWINLSAGQLYRFAFGIEKGDTVLTPIKGTDTILIGEVSGGYEYVPHTDWPHIREVKWKKHISRADLSVPARNSIGAISTVFSMDEHLGEITNLVEGKKVQPGAIVLTREDIERGEIPPLELEREDIELFSDETEQKARGLIIDRLNKIDGYNFQKLVAAVFRARGYRTKEYTKGKDEGVDITIYSDDLGLSPVNVQVKHRKGSMGAPDVREFLGTLRNTKGGLYISTGSFTTDARKIEHGNPVRLLDVDDFVDLLIESYEKLEPEFKAMIPLKKIYMPR